MSLDEVRSIYLLKDPDFSFVDFYYSLLSFSIIYALDFMISFPLLTLGFSISSSYNLVVKLGYFFDFSLFS